MTAGPDALVTVQERRSGRLLLRDFTAGGIQEHSFIVSETEDVLSLEVIVRVYEEVAIHTQIVEREARIVDVLRRHEADIATDAAARDQPDRA